MISRYLGCALSAFFAFGTAAYGQTNAQAYGGQPALLQPGQADPNAPITLHMPTAQPAVPLTARPKQKAKPKASVAATKPAAPAQQTASQQTGQDMMTFGPVPGANMFAAPSSTPPKFAATPPKAPAPKKVASVPKAVPKPPPVRTTTAVAPAESGAMSFMPSTIVNTPAPAKPSRSASVEPADLKNMTKRSSIPFAPAAEEPAPEVLDTIRTLSGDLNSALGNGSARVELEAFGGKPNDKSSDARRLSLKRALIVRQLLIDEGVPSERIDVRAMGGAASGAADRVDIFVRA